MGILIYIIVMGAIPITTYFIGKYIENRHYDSIEEREEEMKNILIFNEKRAPSELVRGKFHLVSGSVVISGSRFKQIMTHLKSIFGGRLGSLETVMDMGRREAILRMKEEAKIVGANIIFNVRFETTTLSERVGKQGVFCAEFFVYGTAWKKSLTNY